MTRAIVLALFVVFGRPALGAITGYGVFQGNTTTAPSNITNLFQANPYSMRWTINKFDSTYFSHSTSSFNQEVTIQTAGDYRISLQIPLEEVSGSNRRSVRAEVYINGSPLDIGRAESTYIRDNNNHTESSLHLDTLLEGLSTNDVIEVRVSAETSQTGEVSTSGAKLFIQFVDPSVKTLLLKASGTTAGTDLNPATATALSWNEKPVTSMAYTHSTVTNPNQITFAEGGSYRVSLNIPLQDPSACPGNNRTSVQAIVKLDGTAVRSGYASQGYIRCADDHQFASIHWFGFLHNVTIGQVLTVDVIRETTVGQAIQVPSSRKASLFLEQITDTSKIISLHGTQLTSGTNWNPTNSGSIQWTGEVLKDAAVYSHSTATNSHQITFSEDGDYLIFYNDILQSSVQRANPSVQFRINGSLPDGAECSSHYIRNQNGHAESSCSVSYLLENISSGDVLEVALSAEAQTGTVNDKDPAVLHIFQISNDPPILDINSIPNKILHYDASDLSNVLDSSGRDANDVSFSGQVEKFKDISGSEFSHDAIQTTASEQPTFNVSTKVLNFDGVNDFFDIANASDINTGVTDERTFAMVIRTGADVSSRQMIYEEGGTVRGINIYIDNGLIYLGFWNDTNDGDGVQPFTSTSTAVSANTNYYITIVFDYSNYTGPSGPDGNLRGTINGTPFSFTGTSTSRLYSHPGLIGLGAMSNGTCYHDSCPGGNGNYFQGDIFEFIGYNAAISPALEIEYYNFFANKWPDPFPVTDLDLDSQYTSSTSDTPNITWTASISTDIDHYEVAIGTTVGGTDVQAYTNVGNVTNAVISGQSFSECVNLYASVKAVDSEPKESTVETTPFFKYDGTNPTDPSSLTLSGSASESVSRTLSWGASNDTCAFEKYEVSLGTSAGGTQVVDWTDIGTSTSHQFTSLSLTTATDYFINVRAHDAAGNTSNVESSAAWQLDTCVSTDTTDPTDPSGLTVVGNAGTTFSPTLNWTAASDACGFSHYEISIGTSAGATDIVSYANISDVLTYKFWTISPNLSTNTNYFFNLKAVDLAGNESNVVSSAAWQIPAPGGVSANLVLWLDANDIGTLYQSSDCSTTAVTTDGQFVECWRDKSTSGNNATATGSARPTYQTNEFNGNPVIRLDGTNDAVDFTAITDARTVFIVNKSSATTYQPLMGHSTTTNWFTNDNTLLGAGSSSFLTGGAWRVNRSDIPDPQVYTQSGQYSLYSVVTTGNVQMDHIASDRKTAGRYHNGDYVEVIVYDRALNSTEVANIENYLFNKWFSAAPPELENLTTDSGFTAISSTTPTLTWDHSSAPDLDYYEVALGTTEGQNDAGGWFNIGRVVNSYQFTGANLSECSDYFMSVRAVDTDGYVGTSASAAAIKFDSIAPSAPTSLNITGSASASVSKTLSWASSSDACEFDHYEVALGTTPTGNEVVGWTDVGGVLTYQFTGLSLSTATNYYINVRGVDGAGNISPIAASAAWQVDTCVSTDTTDPLPPTSFILSGTPELRESPQGSWTSGSDACAFSHHEVAIGTNTTTDNVVSWTNIGTSSLHQFVSLASNLDYDTNYYMLVKSVDQAGNDSTILASSAWSLAGPASVSATGLTMWVDAQKDDVLFQDDSCSTAVTTNNQQVGCFKDLSGNDNHLTVSSSANKPSYRVSGFNGDKAIYFDGASNEFLKFNSLVSDARTVFWVVKEDVSNPGDTAFLLGDPDGSTQDFARGSTSGPIFSGASASANVTGGTLQLNKNLIDGTTTNMPTSESVLSLVTTGNVTAGAFSRDRTSCCGGRTFGGVLAELIIYNRALNGTEIGQVEDYLMSKWSLVSSTTQWTGAVDTTWSTAGNWTNGVPTASLDCEIPDQANDPIITGGIESCRNLVITTGNLTFQNTAGAQLKVYGDVTVGVGTITINDGEFVISDNGTVTTFQDLDFGGEIINLDFDKTAGGDIELETSLTVNSFTMPSGSNFDFYVKNGTVLSLPNGMTQNGGTFDVLRGGSVLVGNANTISVTAGTFKTSGINDTLPQSTTNKATLGVITAGDWAFSATGGIVSMEGFIIDNIDSNGLYIGGNADLAKFDGGQFINLNTDYATPVKALHLDTSTLISESLAENVGFMWATANSTYSGTPGNTDNFYTVYASNCGGGTLIFDQWFGDFFNSATNLPLTEAKIYDDADTGNCSISMDIAASPVTISSFTATAYDESVVIEWETSSELNHMGFNIYRSTDPSDGFSQINQEMFRNYLTSAAGRGKYRFVDANLTNDQIYYYMIEDIATNGDVDWHGPVYATPDSTLGAVPAVAADTNTPESLPGSSDLGNGVALLSQTLNSFRISINPTSISSTTAPWNSSYLDVEIPGYTKLAETAKPAMLVRKILVPVDSSYSTITSTQVNLATSNRDGILVGKDISPVPTYTANGSGVLESSYLVDAAAYSDTSDYPSSWYSVKSSTVQVLDKHYVQITVYPLKYQAGNDVLNKLDQVVLDIGLSGAAWNYSEPTDVHEYAPAIVEGSIRVKYNQEGIYNLTYDSLANDNIEGPLDGEDVTNFRGYYHGEEISLQISSTTGFFSSGDSILFYGKMTESLHDDYDEIVISPYDFAQDDGASEDPLRIEVFTPVNGAPDAIQETHEVELFEYQDSTGEEYIVLDVPVGDSSVDHLFMSRIYAQGGAGPAAYSTVAVTFNTSDLDLYSDYVYLELSMLSRAVKEQNPLHEVRVEVNNVTFEDRVFQSKAPVALTYAIPTSYFVDGNNTVELTVLGNGVANGQWEIIDVDYMKLTYNKTIKREGPQTKITSGNPQEMVVGEGFQNPNIRVFDISNNNYVFEYGLVFVDTFDGGSNYYVSFLNLLGHSPEGGKTKIVVENNQFLTPSSLSLAPGSGVLLKDSDNSAQFVIIAHDDVVDSANRLAEHRRNEGLTTLVVGLDQVYAEFSNGRKSPYAINDFINFAHSNWSTAPSYLLIIADGTLDPTGSLDGTTDLFAQTVTSPGGDPVLLINGEHEDFTSDSSLGILNLGTEEEGVVPSVAIGRLPSNNPSLIETYIDKLIEYESGTTSPSQGAKKVVFFVGEDDQNEDFITRAVNLANDVKNVNSEYSTEVLSRASYANDAQLNSKVMAKFHEGPLFINYLGHGAETEWGFGPFFDLADANSLSNTKLPIVVGMNCLNSRFDMMNPAEKSLAEQLIFNADGGAIAFWGSTAMTAPDSQVSLVTNLINEFGQRSKTFEVDSRLGQIMLSAKTVMPDHGSSYDTIRSWALIGDPTMKLPVLAFTEPEPAPVSTNPIPLPTVDNPVATSGGGCSLFAADGKTSAKPWWAGALEWLIVWSIVLVPAYIRRRKRTSKVG